MSSQRVAHDDLQARRNYFYLSYAHLPPLADRMTSDPDSWVRRFFNDLQDAVRSRSSSRSMAAAGFFDQLITFSSGWKAARKRALSSAQVFVPLYSPHYFAWSLPGREWASFHQRMADTGIEEPLTRFAPVFWTPLPGDLDPPGLQQALALGATEPVYAEIGVRGLLRLKQYQNSYRLVIDRLADRIVDLAENAPLAPSPAPDLDAVTSIFTSQSESAVFAVTVVAPPRSAVSVLPRGPDLSCYGDRSVHWRPFLREQELPLADYAAEVAEQLDFAVLVMDASTTLRSQRPGLVLIDPWIVAHEGGLKAFRLLVHDLRAWMVPLIVSGSPHTADATEYAQLARVILADAGVASTESARRGMAGVSSLAEFVMVLPSLVADAERQFLRHSPVRVATASSRPVLAGSWSADRTPTPGTEVPNA